MTPHKRLLGNCPPGTRLRFPYIEGEWEVLTAGHGLESFISEMRSLVRLIGSPVVNFMKNEIVVTVLDPSEPETEPHSICATSNPDLLNVRYTAYGRIDIMEQDAIKRWGHYTVSTHLRVTDEHGTWFPVFSGANELVGYRRQETDD